MDLLFKLDRERKRSLQNQLRDKISTAILEGWLAPNTPLPSSRRLAEQLGIARNTVMLAYTALQDDGFIVSRERSGFFVNDGVIEDKVTQHIQPYLRHAPKESVIDWSQRLSLKASAQRNIVKPVNWRDFKYCFVYGQIDPKIFPVRHWRECWRDAVGVQEITDWSQDLIDRDDPLLIEQIRTRLLPRRGLWVDDSQILVTNGAQNALYIALKLLLNKQLMRQSMHGFGSLETGPYQAHMQESVFLNAAFTNKDCQEGVAAFFERRAPKFQNYNG